MGKIKRTYSHRHGYELSMRTTNASPAAAIQYPPSARVEGALDDMLWRRTAGYILRVDIAFGRFQWIMMPLLLYGILRGSLVGVTIIASCTPIFSTGDVDLADPPRLLTSALAC